MKYFLGFLLVLVLLCIVPNISSLEDDSERLVKEEGLQVTPLVREIRAVRPTVHKKSAMSTPKKPLHSHHGSKKHGDPSLVVNKWAQYKKKMSSTKSPNQHAKHASSNQSKKSTH